MEGGLAGEGHLFLGEEEGEVVAVVGDWVDEDVFGVDGFVESSRLLPIPNRRTPLRIHLPRLKLHHINTRFKHFCLKILSPKSIFFLFRKLLLFSIRHAVEDFGGDFGEEGL